jgi:hypothetical protein
MSQAGKPQPGDKVGYGVLYPLRFVGGDFEAGTGLELVQSAAEIIVGAESASEDGKTRGEFPAHPRLGTQLKRYVHKNIRGDRTAVVRAAGLEGITRLDQRIILDPAGFSMGGATNNRTTIGIGLQLDPEFTGDRRATTIKTTV